MVATRSRGRGTSATTTALHHTHAPPPLPTRTLALNWLQILVAPLPALLVAWAWARTGTAPPPFTAANALLGGSLALAWVASLLQGSTWLIDPYWVFIVTPCLDRFYAAACAGVSPASPRASLISGLTALWGCRLQHSYFRRERWRPGAREDWRYADMRARLPSLAWAAASAVVVYALQQGLLVGLALPHYPSRGVVGVAGVPLALWGADGVGVAAAQAGLALAKAADDQRVAYGAAPTKPAVLDAGVWAWSRHPNYVGETLFWWGLSSLAAVRGSGGGRGGSAGRHHWWVLAGAAANTACLVGVTLMTEARTARKPGRAAAWADYCARVPCWVGWRRRKAGGRR
jgi:steroid 5-alpha reductase family enzyme